MEVIVSSGSLKEPPYALSDVKTTIIKDNSGNPIVLAMQQDDRNIYLITAEDPRFNEILKNMGIDKRVAVKVQKL